MFFSSDTNLHINTKQILFLFKYRIYNLVKKISSLLRCSAHKVFRLEDFQNLLLANHEGRIVCNTVNKVILATLNLSYLVLIAIRIADTKKYIRLTLTWRSFLSMAVLVAGGLFYYILPGKVENFAFGVLMSVVLLACVPPEIIKMVLSKIKPS